MTITEIEAEAEIARALYAQRRPAEGREAYRIAHAAAVAQVRELIAASDDLRSFGPALAARPNLLDIARYLDAPPISADDLETVSGQSKTDLSATAMAARTPVLVAGFDPDRFPWLFSPTARPATVAEREAAIQVTAALVAGQRAATVLRNQWAARQEASVAAALSAAGYIAMPRRPILSLPDLPAGQYCPESPVFGQKCDVPVGLRNGRYLLIECKVSGSAVNSFKRLNHETVNKRDEWNRGFGGQAYTAAVLGGVFRAANVLAAQERGVVIFWEHDLGPLAEFLAAVG